MTGHTGWVSALAVTPLVILSASHDTTVRLWSTGSGKLQHTFRDVHSDYVLQLAVAHGASRFVSAGLQGQLTFWDLSACVRISHTAAEPGGERPALSNAVVRSGAVATGSIYALDCTPDGRLAAFNAQGGCVFHLHFIGAP